MKQVRAIIFAVLVTMLFGVANTYSADPAEFGLFNYTSYINKKVVVGDTVRIFPYVDANDHNGLNVINMKLKISDTAVVAPIDQTSFFTPGATYTQLGFQKYSNGVIEILVYINPNDKPTTRTGYIGEIKLTAVKTGNATISYESLEVTEEGNEQEFVETTSIPLDMVVVSSTLASAVVSDVDTSISTSEQMPEATVDENSLLSTTTPSLTSTSSTSSLSDVSTGPVGAVLGSIFGGTVLYFLIKKRGRAE